MPRSTLNAQLQSAWNAFQNQRFEEALRLLENQPQTAETLHFRGAALYRLGQHETALESLNQARQRDPKNSQLILIIAACEQALSRWDDAAKNYNTVISQDPRSLDAHRNLAICYTTQGEHQKALDVLNRFLAEKDRNPDIEILHAQILIRLTRIDDAIEVLQQLTQTYPDNHRGWNELGNLFSARDQWKSAASCFANAHYYAPNTYQYILNLAFAEQQCGEWEKALPLYQSIEARINAQNTQGNNAQAPNIPNELITKAIYNLSIVQLALGNLHDGWRYYRWRPTLLFQKEQFHHEILAKDLTGKRILIKRDQGLGDELFYLRYWPTLAKRNASLTYLCHSNLKSLLTTCTSIHVIDEIDEEVNFDFIISVADLPWLLQEFSIPPPLPLVIPSEFITKMDNWLRSFGPPPYYGLSWRAGTTADTHSKVATRLYKQVNVDRIVETIPCNGSWVVLQRNPAEHELHKLNVLRKNRIIDASHLNNNLLDMTALLSIIDHYICVSNTNLHIRSSIGKPSHVLIPFPPEWRWASRKYSSQWFPNASVYPQTKDGDWSEAFNRLAQQFSN